MPATANRDPNAFRDWLLAGLSERGWSQAQLARELGVFKGTVGRWLLPVEDPKHRRPQYESCRRLARIFDVDVGTVLHLAGLEDNAGPPLTDLQREAIALIHRLPDDALVTVLPRLRALAGEYA